jgi:hypothetical protein
MIMGEQERKLFKWEGKKFYIFQKSTIFGLGHHYILGTTLKSRKYQNDIIETQINNFDQKTKQIIHILHTFFWLVEHTHKNN